MADCFQPWVDNFHTCTAATGGLSIPTDPNDSNLSARQVICAAPACQKLFTVFRSLIDTKCPAALNEVALYPRGMYTTTYCPPVATPPPPPVPPTTTPRTVPTTTTPPPRSTTTSPPVSAAASTPTTTAPPVSTTTTPPTSTTGTTPLPTQAPNTTTPMLGTARSSSSASSLGDTKSAPVGTAALPHPPSAESLTPPSNTTSAAIAASKTSVSTTMIAAAGGGGVLVLLLVVVIVLLVRRRRSASTSERTGTARKDIDQGDVGAEYSNYSAAPTEDTYTQSGKLDGGPVLAGKRIPFRALRFGEVVSQGGFGEVVKGTYNSDTVAIKRLLAARRKDKDNTDSFFKEITLTSTLQHDCLVRFIGYAWDVPSNLCMVSEFMEGGDLRTLMVTYTKSGHSNGHDDGKLRILEQVATALQYLHTLDPPVVHRDLKSRNVLLSANDDAKLIDFGISCERQDYTMTAGVGTKLWMAPEVMLGERYSEKADVFSFGVILSELDTHALPYDDARDMASDQKLTDVKLTQLISQGRIYPRFTNWAEPAIVALARDCLQLNPAMRPRASAVVSQLIRIRRSDLTNSHTGTRGANTGTTDSRAMTRDTVLSCRTQPSTRPAARRGRGQGN